MAHDETAAGRTGVRVDTNFDGIATAFEDEIYGSSKGFIRLHVLWEDLLTAIPELRHGGLSVLDVGGGSGHLALRLARLGNSVVLSDASREMLDRAESAIPAAGFRDAITIVHAGIQDLGAVLTDTFDVVLCHAVLEWLAQPQAAVAELAQFLKSDGWLSLMFYNRNAALLKRVLRGEFAAALREHQDGPSPRGWGDGAVPLAEDDVHAWLAECRLAVRSRAGVRIFHDHLSEAQRTADQLDELLAVELELRGQEPFASLAQHIHLVCVWSG
jgi:S-adenosylmethionine-dependent methyltransferase